MRFILFCEGHTEHRALPAFLKRWLDPRLNAPVGIKPVRFDGWAELIDDAPRKADLYLSGSQSHDVVGVIGWLIFTVPQFIREALRVSKTVTTG